jgi:hypothetical protein
MRATLVTPSAKDPKQESANRDQLERILAGCKPVSPTGPVAKYLTRRGISGLLTELAQSLHEHLALPYFEGNRKVGECPAMIAEVRSPDGQLVSLHRTYLTHSGDGKAPVAEPRKLSRVSEFGRNDRSSDSAVRSSGLCRSCRGHRVCAGGQDDMGLAGLVLVHYLADAPRTVPGVYSMKKQSIGWHTP